MLFVLYFTYLLAHFQEMTAYKKKLKGAPVAVPVKPESEEDEEEEEEDDEDD